MKDDIFKEYDIRGIYPKEINAKIAYKIGFALVRFLGKKNPKITVGRDTRPSSPAISDAFIKGTLEAGANILDVGKVTTPMLYSSVRLLGADGGAMITASHNPTQYNGIKMINNKGEAISGEAIKSFVLNLKLSKKQKGNYKKIDISDKYFEEIARSFGNKKISKRNKISIFAKGTPALFVNKFVEKFKIPIASKKDKKIKFYATFDFDGDRLIILDQNKKEVRGDIIGTIIASSLGKKKDNITYDLRCSKAVPEYFKNLGMKASISKVGRINIKNLMKKQNSIFGMEITGHYFFRRFSNHESPLFALLKILEKAGEEPSLKISQPFDVFNKFFNSGVINLNIHNKNFQKIADLLKKEYVYGASNNLDGLTIEFSNWWFNLRPSHTEPLVRLVIEANSQKLLDEKKKELIDKIKKF